MPRILSCLVYEHNLWLVLLAAMVCVCGAFTGFGLFVRAQKANRLQAYGWYFLSSVALGGSIWCTHFIAMMAYKSPALIELEPVLTCLSLWVAMIGTGLGLLLAGHWRAKQAPWIGGAVVGLSIAAMHYTGMLAYRVKGMVIWDQPHILASIIMSMAFSMGALIMARRDMAERTRLFASGIFVLAVVSLHFTGMAAFKVQVLDLPHTMTNADALTSLALAVAMMGMMIVGTGLVTYLIDNQNQSESIAKLREMAITDVLTGLPNRAGLSSWAVHELARVRSEGDHLAVVVIDLDHFKEINDVHGHRAGDMVLKTISRRFGAMLKRGELMARLGGDEFAALCRYRFQEDLIDFLERLQAALNQDIAYETSLLKSGGSLGVASYPVDGEDLDTLLKNADLAMYRAKTSHLQKICYYEPTMDEKVRERRALAADLRDAITHNQLQVYYQVQTSLGTGEITGYEALVRWKHPVRGFVPPMEFIPLAEETGMIFELGEWVLRQACAHAATWPEAIKVAVNLSPVQVVNADLPVLVHQILINTGLSPSRLELELTESTIINDKVRSLHVLRRIKALGVTIALDDFGTGYSSLATLRTFPFDKIKLDRTFMSEIETSLQAKAIIRAVLALGKSLGVPVLAEGIETPEQMAILSAEGCDEGQGYFLGRPQPHDLLGRDGVLRIDGPASIDAPPNISAA